MKFVEKEFLELQLWLQKFKNITTNDKNVICPICQQAKPLSEFTKEHIIPHSIGGNTLTITCKTCNSKCGHEFDYSINNFLEHQQLLRGNSDFKTKTKATIIVDNVSLNARVKNIDAKLTLIVSEKYNHPKKWANVRESLKYSTSSFKLNISSKWNIEKLTRAFVKIAQLMSIPEERYRYVLSECGTKISDIILGKNNEDISSLIHTVNTTVDLSSGYYEVKYNMENIRFCIIKLKRVQEQDYIYFLVILPGETNKWDEFLETTKEIRELSKDHSINIDLFN